MDVPISLLLVFNADRARDQGLAAQEEAWQAAVTNQDADLRNAYSQASSDYMQVTYFIALDFNDGVIDQAEHDARMRTAEVARVQVEATAEKDRAVNLAVARQNYVAGVGAVNVAHTSQTGAAEVALANAVKTHTIAMANAWKIATDAQAVSDGESARQSSSA